MHSLHTTANVIGHLQGIQTWCSKGYVHLGCHIEVLDIDAVVEKMLLELDRDSCPIPDHMHLATIQSCWDRLIAIEEKLWRPTQG